MCIIQSVPFVQHFLTCYHNLLRSYDGASPEKLNNVIRYKEGERGSSKEKEFSSESKANVAIGALRNEQIMT
jgi:hypothetical protein